VCECFITQEGSTAVDRLSVRDGQSRVQQEFQDRGATEVDAKHPLRGNQLQM